MSTYQRTFEDGTTMTVTPCIMEGTVLYRTTLTSGPGVIGSVVTVGLERLKDMIDNHLSRIADAKREKTLVCPELEPLGFTLQEHP